MKNKRKKQNHLVINQQQCTDLIYFLSSEYSVEDMDGATIILSMTKNKKLRIELEGWEEEPSFIKDSIEV